MLIGQRRLLCSTSLCSLSRCLWQLQAWFSSPPASTRTSRSSSFGIARPPFVHSSMLRSSIRTNMTTVPPVQVGTRLKTRSLFAVAARLGAPSVIVCMIAAAQAPNSTAITITLTGQSMIRSDLRGTAPGSVPVIRGLLKGDVVFTNFECTVAENGETVHEDRGFLAPPEALDALTTFGFSLLSLTNNHAFDLKATGIQNTLREVNRRKIVYAGIGNNLAEAAAPGYLHTPKGTVALVASASGLIAPGARATTDRLGVNELRVEAGDRENEATEDLYGPSENTPNPEDSQRILQSIREARQHADLVIVYQ